MSKHTPGPWEIDHDTRPAGICCVHGLPPHGEQNQTFAYVRGALGYWDADENENLANIRLIAAAPELLEALQAALLVIQDYLEYDHNGDPWTEDARTMGEMDINDYQSDGRLAAALALVKKATGAA